jgi:hypothetical protein
MLALSARQLERKHSRSSAMSLSLYQEAIHELIPHLESRSTAVVASSVVLCVLEMMSCEHLFPVIFSLVRLTQFTCRLT